MEKREMNTNIMVEKSHSENEAQRYTYNTLYRATSMVNQKYEQSKTEKSTYI